MAIGAMVVLGCGVLLIFKSRAQAPASENYTLNDSKIEAFFPAPNFNQKKSVLKSAQTKPLPNNRVSLKQMDLQTFRTNGATEMKMSAPDCVYDETMHMANSPGAIHVESGDGKLTIEGDGFFWRQSDNSFYVSNNVHSTVDSGFLKEKSAATRTNATTANEHINIFSDKFGYDGKAGLGIYDGHMRVTGTNLLLTSRALKIKMPAGTNQVETLLAEDDVVFNYEQIHATGQRALYTTASNLVQLFGNPMWRSGLREGHGDEVSIDRTNKILRSTGNAYLKMPVTGNSAFLPGKNPASTNSLASTNRFVEIYSDFYSLETNVAVFIGNVRGTEKLNGQPQSKISCGALTITINSSNQINTAFAEQKVVIEREDKQSTADIATYTATNGLFHLKGRATWRAALRSGSGDELQMNSLSEQMIAKGHAWMRLPAGELTTPAPTATNILVIAKPQQTTNKFAEIFSDEYTLNTNHAFFSRNVRVDHPQMKMVCDTMSADFSQGNADKTIVAEHNVVIDLADSRLKNVRGFGDKAVYTYRVTETATNDMVEMFGNPRFEDAHGTHSGETIIFDRISSKIVIPKYKGQGSLKPKSPTPDK